MPTRIIQPSGITLISSHSNCGKLVPISLPYVPVSSLVSHISFTPSIHHHHIIIPSISTFSYLGTLVWHELQFLQVDNYTGSLEHA